MTEQDKAALVEAMATLRNSDDPEELLGAYRLFKWAGDQAMARQCLDKALDADLSGDVYYEYGLLLNEEGQPEKVFELFSTGAEFGNLACMEGVARCYLQGVGAAHSPEQGMMWMERAAARRLEAGDPEPAYEVAEIYYTGKYNVPASPGQWAQWESMAREVLRRMAASIGEEGSPALRIACQPSGPALAGEGENGVENHALVRDFDTAVQIFDKYAAQGQVYGPYYYAYGKLYQDVNAPGEAVDKWLAGNEVGSAHSQYALSECLLEGYGVEPDLEKAMAFREAALNNELNAGETERARQYALDLYKGQNGLPMDEEKAREWADKIGFTLPQKPRPASPPRPVAPQAAPQAPPPRPVQPQSGTPRKKRTGPSFFKRHEKFFLNLVSWAILIGLVMGVYAYFRSCTRVDPPNYNATTGNSQPATSGELQAQQEKSRHEAFLAAVLPESTEIEYIDGAAPLANGSYREGRDLPGGLYFVGLRNKSTISSRYYWLGEDATMSVDDSVTVVAADKVQPLKPTGGMLCNTMLAVGRDLPAGQYQLVALNATNSATYRIISGWEELEKLHTNVYNKHEDPRIANTATVTLEEGQFLTLVDAGIVVDQAAYAALPQRPLGYFTDFTLGKRLPKTEYLLYPADEGGTTEMSFSYVDSESGERIRSGRLVPHYYLQADKLPENTEPNISGCRYVESDLVPPATPVDGRLETGMYKVGKDIAAGTYTIEATGENSWYGVTSQPNLGVDNMRESGLFTGSVTVTLGEGDFVMVDKAAILVP